MKKIENTVDRLIDSTYDFGRVMRRIMMGQMGSVKAENLLHLHALFLISEQEGLTMKELAHSLHVSAPSATSLMNRLVRMRWVQRLHDRENRKLVRIGLTPLGKRILREKHERRRAILRQVFGFLNRREQIQLTKLHEKLGRALSTHSS